MNIICFRIWPIKNQFHSTLFFLVHAWNKLSSSINKIFSLHSQIKWTPQFKNYSKEKKNWISKSNWIISWNQVYNRISCEQIASPDKSRYLLLDKIYDLSLIKYPIKGKSNSLINPHFFHPLIYSTLKSHGGLGKMTPWQA